MTNMVNKVLSDLYTDKITIKKACELLGKTREEVWNLLDSFEYSPTSGDVITACKIEQESMRTIEHKSPIDNKLKHTSPLTLNATEALETSIGEIDKTIIASNTNGIVYNPPKRDYPYEYGYIG